VHEIINHLPPDARVLDLGCGRGSFPAVGALTVRVDRERPSNFDSGEFVEADAGALPFAPQSFHAIIANHSLEHFDNLSGAIAEIGRVLRRDGSLYISVPDASTFTDHLYRWLFRGGQHVNAFNSAPELARIISSATAHPHVATLTLYTSLCFLQRSRFHPRPPRRMWMIGNGDSRCIALLTYALRVFDNIAGTRATVYGWALYFGNVASPIEPREWRNVCVDCGTGYPEAWLVEFGSVRSRFGFRSYRCPQCRAWNLLTRDSRVGRPLVAARRL
jgi:Methyltransferase domain